MTDARYAVRFRDRPELRVDSTRLIDTGAIDVHHAYSSGVELAANWRSLSVQGEFFRYGFDRRGGFDDPYFYAFYVQTGYFLTGETRNYNMVNGSFQMPKPLVPVSWPTGGYGAWELAFRYSHTDLDYKRGDRDALAGVDTIRGGLQQVYTVGLNWYLIANFRMSFNYYYVDVNRLNPASAANPAPFGPPPNTPPDGAQIGQDYHVIGIRTQFNF